jgi:hypothetical protein
LNKDFLEEVQNIFLKDYVQILDDKKEIKIYKDIDGKLNFKVLI